MDLNVTNTVLKAVVDALFILAQTCCHIGLKMDVLH